MGEPVIVACCRTAVGRAKRGSLIHTRPDDMGAVVLKEVIKRAGIKPELVEDVVMGCAMPEAEQGMNVARMAVHRAGLPDSIPAMTINRYCSSGMQAIWLAQMDIMVGNCDVTIGGGTETMTMIPMGGNKIVPNPWMAENYPQGYVGMGQTAENVAMKYGISRKEQDDWALISNNRAIAANKEGRFKEQIVPLDAYKFDGKGNKIEFVYDVDEGPRPSTAEGLATLRPAFANPRAKTPEKMDDGSEVKGELGTVTAGNSSQMSDGAAAALLMDKAKAEELGIKPMAKLHGCVTVAFDPNYMGIGPALALPRLKEKYMDPLGLGWDDIDVFEINEAFASQAVYSMKMLGLNPEKVNPNGGAIALGHPLGATGAKLTTQVVYHLKDTGGKWGIVTMCIGGGMGAAGLYENLM